MNSKSVLIKKSIATLKYEGINPFLKKSFSYIKRKMNKRNFNQTKFFKDILFINGCALPHPSRYRVEHQIEQLHFNGYSCDSVYYEDLDVELVKYYRGFVFFRCPHTDIVEDFILKAKYFNKKVFFDVDDLVIDFKYVQEIEYLKSLRKEEYDLYMDGVQRMRKTMLLCDYAITTTYALSEELKSYVPEVFINRNVASEKMVEISRKILEQKEIDTAKSNKIILGYFSGSITHNDDFKMILPVICSVLSEYSNVYLKVVGILDIPEELSEFKDKIIIEKFVNWKELPNIISSVDINLAPLEESIFNEAKSENKWIEAALVKVVTIASNLGAFRELIVNENTGILCSTIDDWNLYLRKLIEDELYRKTIARKAYDYVVGNCITAYTGYNLLTFLESKLNDNIAFILPSTNISGGVNVVIKHCNILRDNKVDVTIISMSDNDNNIKNKDGEINVVVFDRTSFHNYFRKSVATLWSTVEFLTKYPKIGVKYYLIQGFETDFYKHGHIFRVWANLTYNAFFDLKYVTISKWCENWLNDKFQKKVSYAPNGLDLSNFSYIEKKFDGKIRILIEGSSTNENKKIDESFKIINHLNRNIYEIWYLSYEGNPKDWYIVDNFLSKVPYDEVSEVYRQCHILLKSSTLESFSYPPLEMMATGGVVVAVLNEGNCEYLINNENCLLYESGNIMHAVELINEVYQNNLLRKRLIKSGLETVERRNWTNIQKDILKLYDIKSEVIEMV